MHVMNNARLLGALCELQLSHFGHLTQVLRVVSEGCLLGGLGVRAETPGATFRRPREVGATISAARLPGRVTSKPSVPTTQKRAPS
jgi:hypothetical protein